MREERREEREERREKSAERSEKREEITKKAARDPQMRLFEQQSRVCCAPVRVVTEGREQRKERREKREERKSPQARFTAFLHGPVATSKKF